MVNTTINSMSVKPADEFANACVHLSWHTKCNEGEASYGHLPDGRAAAADERKGDVAYG
jgi:hypothetical protein